MLRPPSVLTVTTVVCFVVGEDVALGGVPNRTQVDGWKQLPGLGRSPLMSSPPREGAGQGCALLIDD